MLTWSMALVLAANLSLPQGVILVRGAAPEASDSLTPLPEQGRVVDQSYRNAYFGLSYPIPAGWSEQPAGPPPSDGGSYVLTQFALTEGPRVRAHVLVTAQDLFFSPVPPLRHSLSSDYQIEREPDEVKIAGRTFTRLGYSAPLAGIHWRVFSTDVRCHALTFTFTGTDVAALDAAERAFRASTSIRSDEAPACIGDYATGTNVLGRIDPHFATRRFNTIPVRVVIDAGGRVKHVHLLSAFPDQSESILAALREWQFKPYVQDGKAVEVETGLVFGKARTPR